MRLELIGPAGGRRALRSLFVAALLLAIPSTSWSATGDTATTMREWYSCGGIAPIVSSCELTVGVVDDFEVVGLQSGGTGIYPSADFNGRIEAEWESNSNHWYASVVRVSDESPSMPFEHSTWGERAGSGRFVRGETITVRAVAVGVGPWRARMRIRYVGERPAASSRWYACRGEQPTVTDCVVRFRIGKDFVAGVGSGVGASGLFRITGHQGKIEAEWVSPSSHWAVTCTSIGYVVSQFTCDGEFGGRFKPGEIVTMRARATGVGAWAVQSKVRYR